MKHVTIKDVAKALNVSISTVSRAFNDSYEIHPDTKKLVMDKAKEMGYEPNPFARKLCLNKTSLIGVVVPEFINAFFPAVLMGIQKVMSASGYQVLIMSSEESAAHEMENVKTLERNRVEGFIISLTQETRDVTHLKELLESDTPIVQFNRVSHKLDTPKITFDDYHWAYKATQHLIEQGYKKIYYLSGPSSLALTHSRRKGFQDALKEAGLQSEVCHVIEAGIYIEDGKAVAQKLIDNADIPEAFFCFNDPVAIGAMETFKANGFAIPKQVAFVGFTESRIAKHMSPALTSVEQPSEMMGVTAAKILLDLLKGKKSSDFDEIVLNGRLNIRESSLKE